MERIFDEKEHRYFVGDIEYSGVNSLLVQEGLKKDITQFIPAGILDSAHSKGKAIHKIAEYVCKGTLDDDSVDDRFANQHKQIKEFIADYTPIYIEHLLWHDKYKVAGTTDLIAVNKNDRTTALIDWTSGKGDKELQLVAYYLIVQKYLLLPIDNLIAVYLSDKGKLKTKVYDMKKENDNIRAIESAFYLNWYKRGKP